MGTTTVATALTVTATTAMVAMAMEATAAAIAVVGEEKLKKQIIHSPADFMYKYQTPWLQIQNKETQSS